MAAGIELFNMFARLGLNDSEFNSKVGAAGTKFRGFVGGVQSQMTAMNTAINKGLTVAGGAVATVLGFFGKAGFSFNSQMEEYTTNFEVMLGDAAKAAAKVRELQAMAAKTPFGLSDLASATQTLLAFQVSSDKSTGVLKMLGDVALGNKEKMQGLALVYGQVASAGKLQGQDLLQLINQGFNPLNYIGKRTGETMEQLRDRMGKGKIGIDEVTQAFVDATSEGGQFFQGMEKASKSTKGLWSTFMDDFGSFAGEVLTPVSEAWKNDIIPALSDALGVVRAAFREVAGFAGAVGGTDNGIAEKSVDWLTRLNAAWSDGKKETKEQVQQFIDEWKTQSGEIKRQIAERRKALEGKGADTSVLDAQTKQLDEYDAKIEALLKKKKGKKFTAEDQKELEEAVAARNKLAEQLTNPMGEAQEAGSDFAKNFGGTIAKGIKKAGEIVAWMVKNWDKLSAGLEAAGIALGVFKIAMLAVNLVMAANPIGLIITGIAALIAVFAYFFQTNEKFRDGVLFVWENLKIGFQKIGEFFKPVIDAIVDSWNAWVQVFKGAWGWLSGIFGKIGGWFKGLNWKIPSIDIPAALKTTIETVKGWWEAAKTWFTGLSWSFPDLSVPITGQGVIDTIQGWADKALTWFKGLSFTLPGIEQPITGEAIINTVQGWADSALNWFKGLSFQLPGMEQPITGEDIVNRVSGWASDALSWFKGLSFKLPTVEQPLTGEEIITKIQGWADSALNWFKGLSFKLPGMEQPITGEEIITKVQGWADAAKNWFSGLSFKIPGVEQPITGEDIITKVGGWANDALNWFKGLSFALPEITLPTDGQGVIDTIKGWWEEAKGWFTGLDWSLPELTVPEWVTTIQDAVTGFINTIKGAFEGLQAAINAVWPPKISMPHFTVSGSMNPIDWFTQGVPKVDVSWYARGGIFTRPTIFDTPYGPKGFGEAGAEAVLPLTKLWSEMSARMKQTLDSVESKRRQSDPMDGMKGLLAGANLYFGDKLDVRAFYYEFFGMASNDIRALGGTP